MNPILEDAAALQTHHGPRGCVERAMATHPDLATHILGAVWATTQPDVEATAVSRALARRDVKLSAETIRRHVRNICACNPTTTGPEVTTP